MIRYLPRKSKYYSSSKIESGETLIGILIALTLLSILIHASFTLVSSLYTLISFNRARISAKHLAQEKMELIRNLPYDEIGTQGGIPSGTLLQNETIQQNGLNFNVKTDIIYIDDPFDDTSPDDLLPTDYKRVRVGVSWGGITPSRNPIVFVTDVAPKGVETSEGGGTLSILVFDADGQPVPEANVQIIASSVSPAVSLDLQTGENGRIILPGAPECIACYEITVSKQSYTSERTYSTSEVANPDKPHQSVFEGDLTEISFAIDMTSTLNIATFNNRESDFSSLGNVTLEIRGSKTIGTDQDENPVYKYTNSVNTDSSGNLTLSDMEWGQYQISLPSVSSFNISGTNPNLPLSISPDSEIDLDIALSPSSDHNLLLTFLDPSSTPQASVSAILSNNSGFSQSIFSGGIDNPDIGQAFFEDLELGTYNFTATASGFLDFSGNIPIDGETSETIILIPN